VKRFTASDINKRLAAAGSSGSIGLFVFVGSLVAYGFGIWFYRGSFFALLELGHTGMVRVVAAAITVVPIVFLPKLYRFLIMWIANKHGLACPACGEVIPAVSDWQRILFTGLCPRCRAVILAQGLNEPNPAVKND
jgi:hypothetical protein